VCCSVLQCVAVCCSVLQCVAVCCSACEMWNIHTSAQEYRNGTWNATNSSLHAQLSWTTPLLLAKPLQIQQRRSSWRFSCYFSILGRMCHMHIGRLLKSIGLFCKRALWKRRCSAKETYNLILILLDVTYAHILGLTYP